MRILIVHNRYRLAGGEDTVVESELALLRSHGHTVETLVRESSSTETFGLGQKLVLLRDIAWSRDSHAEVLSATRRFKADVVHAHNTHPLWSPSIFSAAHQAGAATVLTLHNYRLACMNALMMRNGRPCTECLDHGHHRGVLHGCAPGGRVGSLAMARMLHVNSRRGTWTEDVDAFIALTDENAKETFIRAGLPAQRIFVKPNFLDDPMPQRQQRDVRRGALFIGNLLAFKGVEMLIQAWKDIDYPLSLVGNGPLYDCLRGSASSSVTFAGMLSVEATLDMLAGSSFVVFPSLAREGFPRVIVEAFAMGRAVIASRHGAMAEVVRHNETGLLYEPGSVVDLRRQIGKLVNDPGLALRLGRAARQEYLAKYTATSNYGQLMNVYNQALDHFNLRCERPAELVA